jgi:hypothetical protein
MSVSVKVILLVGHDKTLYIFTEFGNSRGLQAYQRKDGLSHYQNLTSLSVFGSILKDFLGTGVGKCEGCTFG